MSALLGLDLGERRIGVAIADPAIGLARPLVTLRRARTPAEDAAALVRLVDAHTVKALVVGLPLEAAGQEGSQAASTRDWVAAVRPLLPDSIDIRFQDERLTSHLAEERLGPMPRGRSGGPPTRQQRQVYRARVDREAAAIILQDSLDAGRPAVAPRQPAHPMETPS